MQDSLRRALALFVTSLTAVLMAQEPVMRPAGPDAGLPLRSRGRGRILRRWSGAASSS